ncbi:nuclear transport factor 2 family protein [Sphingomonas sp. KC8]|uniref:nuclear transport factor 2 family protein n=1 Tax=Sphingomonas sp. KC8 TaxID=1030157 RepID=UPI000248AB50|nr:nuclear transport factor 2 family protein [Sphingomonas sp. KC8]ARS26831.1 limonene-1,2-epoxide hydrolase [Sphingomonas sp. KC8]
MGRKQEDFVREFCAAWGDGSLETKPDVEKILSMMAEDAEWQLWVPGGPIVRGKVALREEIERQKRIATNNKCNEVNILSSDVMVMQERSDTAMILGKPCPHQMVAIYEFDEQGLISRWREYLDMADLTRKMGVDETFAGTGG